ncbi:hypothetical protein ACFPIJ_00275 [Dactylosporangium cerinum]|uniref:Uncharacterized protein n=1 Tax=Dactylosporangium cerinum TaxID=1434730 RepID=A0ABV9VIX6_9ACTN
MGTVVGSAKPLNSTWPDAVYGVGGVKKPELIFDLKRVQGHCWKMGH